MVMSTIYQLSDPDTPLRHAIGRELRRRRRAADLSQAAVGAPFTRALVCAVERGRVTPSIPALAVFLDHLGVDFDDFFSGVQSEMTEEYNPRHGERDPYQAAPRRRR